MEKFEKKKCVAKSSLKETKNMEYRHYLLDILYICLKICIHIDQEQREKTDKLLKWQSSYKQLFNLD